MSVFKTDVLNKKVKPIIKWTGGKYAEYPEFQKYIPAFDRYLEPFFGGGGVFFALQPKQPALLNDISTDLITFYSLIRSHELKYHLLTYADAWDSAGKLSKKLIKCLLPAFRDYITGVISKDEMKHTVNKGVNEHIAECSLLTDEAFIIDKNRFVHKLQASLSDKFNRIKALCLKEKRIFDERELGEHIETGVKSGLFLYMRNLMNQHTLGQLKMNPEKAAANWYFVREFCYASMFRFNAKNEFNIPYGGIAYNKKNFRQKAESIFSPQIARLFEKATFFKLDFEEFLHQSCPAKGDFIFLDPPYDSEFSEYDQNSFTKDDQVRLRNTLSGMPAKWMLVIKETAFIQDLYASLQCRIIHFDKTYTYNVRGRNNRDTKHLIIMNYDINNQDRVSAKTGNMFRQQTLF